jgi:hypothetical protein
MQKEIFYNGKKYTIEIKWSGSAYCVRAIGIGGFYTIPKECFDDIEKIKPYIIRATEENNHDLKVIELWDGNI